MKATNKRRFDYDPGKEETSLCWPWKCNWPSSVWQKMEMKILLTRQANSLWGHPSQGHFEALGGFLVACWSGHKCGHHPTQSLCHVLRDHVLHYLWIRTTLVQISQCFGLVDLHDGHCMQDGGHLASGVVSSSYQRQGKLTYPGLEPQTIPQGGEVHSSPMLVATQARMAANVASALNWAVIP